MDWLEQELKVALARKDPSPDFAARVAARARRGRVLAIRRWMAAAAAVVVLTGGGLEYREYRGREAKEQVMLAMRITAGKLNLIQNRVREMRP